MLKTIVSFKIKVDVYLWRNHSLHLLIHCSHSCHPIKWEFPPALGRIRTRAEWILCHLLASFPNGEIISLTAKSNIYESTFLCWVKSMGEHWFVIIPLIFIVLGKGWGISNCLWSSLLECLSWKPSSKYLWVPRYKHSVYRETEYWSYLFQFSLPNKKTWIHGLEVTWM